MEIRPDQLSGNLKKALPDITWIAGDEPLLVEDCVAEVRQAAAGVTGGERRRYVLEPGFSWPEFAQACAESSLFSPRTLIELHMAEPKPGKQGGDWLRRLAERPPGGNPLLLVSHKLPRETKNTAWAKTLLKSALLVTIWPLRPGDLPGWIRRELKANGLDASNEAVQVLAECTEGNLLATRQEIRKLALLEPGGSLDAERLRGLLADQSRFSVFELVDAALAGQPGRALHCLQALRETGAEAIGVLWALAREVRSLHNIVSRVAAGRPLGAAVQEEKVWKSRQQLVSRAAGRLKTGQLDRMLLDAAEADLAIKGRGQVEPWQKLEEITLALAGRPLAR